MQPTLTGLDHLKIFVTDLARSRTWYEQVFGVQHEFSFQDEDGVIRGLTFRTPGAARLRIALREDRRWATALAGADPFAFSTDPPALQAWVEHLDTLGVDHSPIVNASAGHILAFSDPRRHATTPLRLRRSGAPSQRRPGRSPAPRPSPDRGHRMGQRLT